jgi:hypothetical protein
MQYLSMRVRDYPYSSHRRRHSFSISIFNPYLLVVPRFYVHFVLSTKQDANTNPDTRARGTRKEKLVENELIRELYSLGAVPITKVHLVV